MLFPFSVLGNCWQLSLASLAFSLLLATLLLTTRSLIVYATGIGTAFRGKEVKNAQLSSLLILSQELGFLHFFFFFLAAFWCFSETDFLFSSFFVWEKPHLICASASQAEFSSKTTSPRALQPHSHGLTT